MLADPGSSGGYAQSGYVKDERIDPSRIEWFTQSRRTSSYAPITKYIIGPTTGTAYEYETAVNSSTSLIGMYIQHTLRSTTTWAPESWWGPQPWSNQFSGETGQCETGVPGSSSSKAHFTLVQQQQTKGGLFKTTVGLTTGHDCTYSLTVVSATAFDIGTP